MAGRPVGGRSRPNTRAPFGKSRPGRDVLSEHHAGANLTQGGPMAGGRMVIERVESNVLEGNSAGDPHVRSVPIYLPPSYDSSERRRFPVAFVLTGFTGR